MPSAKSHFKRFVNLGPGGWKCACCTPAPRGPKLKKFFRIWKKQERTSAIKEELQALTG